MAFGSLFQGISSEVTVVRQLSGGTVTRTAVDCSVQAKKAFFRIDVDLEEGDHIEQLLPTGKAKIYRVNHVTHYAKPVNMAHVEAEIEPVGAVANSSGENTSQSPGCLRVLYLTASPAGDLRVDQEIRSVRAAIRAANGRALVSIEHLSAATGGDLLDGLTRFRPQVVHFSGHADEFALTFDSGADVHSHGNQIGAETFAAALAAVDEPPAVVVLNACNSAPQLGRLTGSAAIAIGMSDSVGDHAAIAFAARLYAAIADGQSIRSAFTLAKVDMQMRGLTDADLPTLAAAHGMDPAGLVLVRNA